MGFSTRKIYAVTGRATLVAMLLAAFCTSKAQVADKIIAVVGRNRIILKSDLDMQMLQMKQQNPDAAYLDSCSTLQSMVIQRMMMEQAERDSVRVTDEDVEGQLDNRLRYFTSLYGSKEKLEQVAGKTIYQMKEEYRDIIRDQMVYEKLQGQILEHVKITPAEVDAFYKKIPVDSLPMFPAAVEVGQIVIDPPVSQEMADYAHQRMEEIRAEVVSGAKSFEVAAGIYSEDPGSKDNGGRYDGVTRTGPWADEFKAATFKLQNGEISPLVKTKFGYHIIQMISRRGDEADVRHILVKPQITTADFNKATHKLDSVRELLVNGKMAFPEAVGKFSTDESAKRTGGMITDPTTGSTELDITKLDPGMVLMLDSMKQGSYSKPHVFVTDAREQSARIVFLRTRTDPHKANLRDDYGKIQEVALQQKKQLKLQSWVTTKAPTYYIKVVPEYQVCPIIGEWIRASGSNQ
ncbi:MAG: peptidylprolyl isomerase [Bacteroidota bacterium]